MEAGQDSCSRRRPSQFDSSTKAAILEVLKSQVLWRGNGPSWGAERQQSPVTDVFEDAFAEWFGLPFTLAVNSGTSANEAAVASLGLAPGTEVVCPAASPIFVPFAVLAVGCIPVFADVDPRTLTPTVETIERVCSERTGAIVVVHLWGRPAPVEAIVDFARQRGLKVVEDCAQAPNTWVKGKRVGTFGDIACFSFQQSKLISAGEGGLIATAGRAEYARATMYSNTGIPYLRYGVSSVEIDGSLTQISHFGHNHRMSNMHAAVALSQLRNVDELVERRRQVIEAIEEEVSGLADLGVQRLPMADGADVSYWRYPILVPQGRGNYIGIPPLEPVFQRMQELRRTPYGAVIPDNVSYQADEVHGALRGAARISVLPLSMDMNPDDGRQLVRALRKAL